MDIAHLSTEILADDRFDVMLVIEGTGGNVPGLHDLCADQDRSDENIRASVNGQAVGFAQKAGKHQSDRGRSIHKMSVGFLKLVSTQQIGSVNPLTKVQERHEPRLEVGVWSSQEVDKRPEVAPWTEQSKVKVTEGEIQPSCWQQVDDTLCKFQLVFRQGCAGGWTTDGQDLQVRPPSPQDLYFPVNESGRQPGVSTDDVYQSQFTVAHDLSPSRSVCADPEALIAG